MSRAPAPVDTFTRRILDLLFLANALEAYFPRIMFELPSAQYVLMVTIALLLATAIWLELRRNFSVWLLVGFVLVTYVIAWDGGMGLVPVAVVTIFVRYGMRSGITSAVILWLAIEVQRVVMLLIGPDTPRELALAVTRGVLDTMVPVILGASLLRRQQIVGELADSHRALSWTHRELAIQTELRQELMRATEHARSAKVLHDGLGRQLSGAASAIDLAAERGADHVDQLSAARTLLAEALREMRTWVRVMNPANQADTAGLSGLPALAASFAGTGLAVHLDLPPSLPTLGQSQSLFVTRFIQEGIANAIEHGGASNVWVGVQVNQEQLGIELTDDGLGGDQAVEGFGLGSLRERAAELGGQFSAHAAGTGFVLRTAIPVGVAR